MMWVLGMEPRTSAKAVSALNWLSYLSSPNLFAFYVYGCSAYMYLCTFLMPYPLEQVLRLRVTMWVLGTRLSPPAEQSHVLSSKWLRFLKQGLG